MFTSVDFGSHSIKIVVSEKVHDKFHVIASTNVRSMGIKKGLIKDYELALNSLKEAVNNINEILGVEIKQVLLNFPLFSVNTTIESADIPVSGIVTGDDIQKVINKAVNDNIPKKQEVLYLEPIVFEIDSDLQVIDPKGLTSSKLKVRCAVSTIESEFLYQYLKLFHDANLEVVDVMYSILGDYCESYNLDINKKLGVVLNFGYNKTEIALFNKGILLKGMVLPIGTNTIDKDISYIYKIDKKMAISLKEKFAVASFKYADKNDIMEVTNISGDRIIINQLEISQVVEARLKEIIKCVKSEIKNLTNRKISYIIISGGVTNLTGFPYLIDEEFNFENIICNMTTLGVRNNIYSGSFGSIKYFEKKMKFRNIDYTMFSDDAKNLLTSKKKKVSTRDALISKFTSYLKSN